MSENPNVQVITGRDPETKVIDRAACTACPWYHLGPGAASMAEYHVMQPHEGEDEGIVEPVVFCPTCKCPTRVCGGPHE